MAAWIPPVALPAAEVLRAAVGELERGLRPAAPALIAWSVGVMAHAMGHAKTGQRAADALAMALRTEGWIVACADLPDDLWSAGTRELLQSKTFFPAPAELLAAVGGRLAERRRMLERAKLLLAKAAAPVAPRPTVETREQRLRASLASFRRLGLVVRAQHVERQLAELTGGST